MERLFSRKEIVVTTSIITFVVMSFIALSYPLFMVLADRLEMEMVFASDLSMYFAIWIFNLAMMATMYRLNIRHERYALEPYRIVEPSGVRKRLIGIGVIHLIFWITLILGWNFKVVIITTATFELVRLWLFPTLWTNREGFSVGNKFFTYKAIKEVEERFASNLEITLKEGNRQEMVTCRSIKNKNRLVKLLNRKRLMKKVKK